MYIACFIECKPMSTLPWVPEVFFLVRGDRIERRSRVAKRRVKNLWHQRITTSLPCRRQSTLIDIRSLLFSHLGKTGLAKIIAHLTNSSPFKKRFFNRPIRFPESNFDSGEINGNVIGSARSKDFTAWARGLSPTSTTRSYAPRRWRTRRPLASRVCQLMITKCKHIIQTETLMYSFRSVVVWTRCVPTLTYVWSFSGIFLT